MPIPASPPRPWDSFGITHTGNIRRHNEDAFLALPEQRLWIAADGMGGHTAGDFASRLIVDQFRSFKALPLTGHSVDQIRQNLAKVNHELWTKAQQMGDTIIGSTVAILLATEHHVATVWSGDSRIYRLRDGLFKQITRDHSDGEEFESRIDDFVRSAFPNAVTQAIGAAEELQVEMEIRENRPGDTYRPTMWKPLPKSCYARLSTIMAGTISPWCWLTTRLLNDTDSQCIQDDTEPALQTPDLPGLLITGFS